MDGARRLARAVPADDHRPGRLGGSIRRQHEDRHARGQRQLFDDGEHIEHRKIAFRRHHEVRTMRRPGEQTTRITFGFLPARVTATDLLKARPDLVGDLAVGRALLLDQVGTDVDAGSP